MSLPKPCKHRGCPRITRGTYCDEHQVKRDQEYDGRRGSASERGYGARHREWRKRVLKRDRVCQICRVAEATVADHVVPIRDGGARFDLENGQGLCAPCHNSVKQSLEKRGRQ